MRLPLRLLLAVMAVFAVAIAGAGPARASWYVSTINYTYGGNPYSDYDVFEGGVLIGHIKRCPCDSGIHYYAEATAIATTNAHWNTIVTDDKMGQAGERVLGFGNYWAQVVLGGGPPPGRPSTWLQRSNLTAQFNYHFQDNGAQRYSGIGYGMMGTIGHNPPTMGWYHRESWGTTDPNPDYRTSEQHNLTEPDYVSRTTLSSYLAGWVYARATAKAMGAGNETVVVWTEGCGCGYVEHSP